MLEFNEIVKKVLKCLTQKGYEAYIVGGAVRNKLLNIEPNDYDITTNATPDEILNVFSFTKTIITGKKYGTITVIFDYQKFEITTFRMDGKYINNRHPENVLFSDDIDEDLKRRDFTINAIAYNNKIIDNHNGINDLHNKIIRCIGDPIERFTEDALRMLRAIRFSCKLDFIIEEQTKQAIHKCKKLLNNISIERINNELFELFKYINEEIIIEYFDVFMIIFPHFTRKNIDKLVKKISIYKEYLDKEIYIYASFFENIYNENVSRILKKYKVSKRISNIIIFINNKNLDLSNNIIDYRKLLKNNTKNDIICYIKYNILNVGKQIEMLKKLEIANKKCNKLNQLNLKGTDLKRIGFYGNEIGIILNKILDLVICDVLVNDKEILIDYAKTLRN